MYLSLKTCLRLRRFKACCAMAVGLALALGVQAADVHGGDHHEEPKTSAVQASESHASETRLPAKTSLERKAGGKVSGKGVPLESVPEARTSVSMAELRDLIDQKIAEVRAQRQAAPVVRLRPKAKAAAKPAVAASSHGAASPVHDAQGALLPLERDHGHGTHDPAPGRALDPHGRDVHWAYSGDTGPENWGRLKPEFQLCMRGKRQSPIDIRDGIAVQLDPIQFDYRPSGFRVIDNGHTVQVNVEPGNGIVVNGNRYELLQFHFHRPSEERINGRQFEMVAHLVHKDMEGRLAVVAVLMEAGKGHPVVQQVWNNLPLEKQIEQASLTQMDLTLLLPAQRQYYTYMGSLTTPPCSEGVLWMVMKHPAAVSREQIAVFGKLYQMNARPIQAASGRLIKEGQ